MPVFLDGQQNLAALTVPGVYGDIILPTPMLLGQPTNIMGLVGVGSWGPLNSLIPVSKPLDCTLQLGTPKIRLHDIASYVAAACQVGPAIGFMCVRVSDGTDAAATTAVQTGGLTASGYVLFSANPALNDTLTLNGTLITFTGALRGGTLTATLATLIEALNNSADANLSVATYTLVGTQINVSYDAPGTAGNAYTMAKASTAISLSGSNLTGGAAAGGVGLNLTAKYSGTQGNGLTFSIQNGSLANSYLLSVQFPGMPPEQINNVGGTGNAFWINAAAAINGGNAYSRPSQFIVASAGASTSLPTLSTPVGFSGGTDGDVGVTDATLMGQDTVPRKGMYALRNSLVDSFTLCDLATIADYAAIGSFGVQESMLPVFASPSGDTINSALGTRISAALDTPWFWYILGDWPSFYDAFNGVTRLISPSAFGLGIIGNLSPQQNPLNKPLQGISSTQRSAIGQTYSDIELSLINTGGIDTIIPPQQSPGGYYFSFGAGRNTSSNTAANGIEYTRMTDFLIRTAKSKAAGSFIGRLQSIQPNDQTRAQAKALFDGFSAQLAAPQFGLGIDGSGMIDFPWLVQCDLLNNPPAFQALGYLFLYWQVRYLNVVRYFVIKFLGGGNVTVNVQNNAPAPSQFASTLSPNVLGGP